MQNKCRCIQLLGIGSNRLYMLWYAIAWYYNFILHFILYIFFLLFTCLWLFWKFRYGSFRDLSIICWTHSFASWIIAKWSNLDDKKQNI